MLKVDTMNYTIEQAQAVKDWMLQYQTAYYGSDGSIDTFLRRCRVSEETGGQLRRTRSLSGGS